MCEVPPSAAAVSVQEVEILNILDKIVVQCTSMPVWFNMQYGNVKLAGWLVCWFPMLHFDN
jgi:hypothetical protein